MDAFGKSMRFYLLVTTLTRKIRTGWDENHWGITADRLESIGEHVFSVIILAISIQANFKVKIDLERVVIMLAIHEIGEAIIGDITPFDGITPEEKEAREHEAMYEVLETLDNRDELYEMLLEFDKRETNDAKFAYFCDKLQANITSKWYQDNGYHKSLDNQENNVAFKSEKCQKILKDGAKTPFDVWYASDIAIFKNDPVFTGFMDWIKDNTLCERA